MSGSETTPGDPAVIHATNDLLMTFYMALDTGSFDTLVGCMAEDGVWHRRGSALKGHAEILKTMAERGSDVRTAHIITNYRVNSSSANAANAEYYMIGYRYDGAVKEGDPSPMDVPFSIGLCGARFKKTDCGWKIAELTTNPRFKR